MATPSLDLNRIDVRDLGRLELLAKQVVEGFIIGLHKSPFHGFSVEFAEHKLYNPGESTKNIDWKVAARTDRLYIKKFEEETNLRCQIVLDASGSMYFPKVTKGGGEYINKIRFSALAIASLMNLLRKQRDAFGLTIFNEKIQTHTRARTNTQHYRRLLTHLHEVAGDEGPYKETDAATALHQIAESIHKRSLVIIFSDMFDHMSNLDPLFSAMQHLRHAKHEVVLFHTVDKQLEEDFEFENRPYVFVDLETQEEVKLQANQVKDFYVDQIKKFKSQLRLKCLQYHIDFVEADINQGFRPILQSYLVKRSKMR